MFEREIKFIYDFNLNKVNKLGPYFTFEQLSAIDLHPAILNYISAEIDYIIFEDRQKLLKNSAFDYSGEKIAYYFSLINEEVKKTKRLSFEYVSKLILHASSFTINYLVRPKWTLQKFVFDESEHKTTNEIKQILSYVYYYNYLKKILISYINSKKILSMNMQEFGELLDKIDKIGIETNLRNILSTALKSMAEFFNIGELQKNKIPLQAIELFLEEKNLEQHLRKIRIAFGDDKTIKCNVKDIQKELNAVMMEEHEQILEVNIQPQIEAVEEPSEKIEEETYEDVDENHSDIEVNSKLNSTDIEKEYETETSEDSEIESEQQPIEDKENDEISISYKPKKLRIRVDKNNEIEPVEDELKNEEETKEETSFPADEDVTISTSYFSDKHSIVQKDLQSDEISKGELENLEDENLEEDYISESEEEENNLQSFQEEPSEDGDSMLKSIREMENELEKKKESFQPEVEQYSSEKIKSEEKEKYNSKSIDVAELLEHKETTKIVETIFDYDIEEFSNVLESISNCSTLNEAYRIIEKEFLNRGIDINSKEAELFKSIISKNFKSTH